MKSLRSFAPHDHRRGDGGRTGIAPRLGQCPSTPHCRPIFAFEHCGGTVKAWNYCFSADLSGARPRRWKSEFLSIVGRSPATLEKRIPINNPPLLMDSHDNRQPDKLMEESATYRIPSSRPSPVKPLDDPDFIGAEAALNVLLPKPSPAILQRAWSRLSVLVLICRRPLDLEPK